MLTEVSKPRGMSGSQVMRQSVVLVFVATLGMSCSSTPPYRSPTTRPTTRVAVPREMVVLSSREGGGELAVERAGPYRLYASNAPYHLIATARLQAGDVLRLRGGGGEFIWAEYEGERERGSFVLPVQEGVEYFWAEGVWGP